MLQKIELAVADDPGTQTLAPEVEQVFQNRIDAILGEKTFEEVEIPRHIFVRCPKAAWKLRQATACDGCPFFRGLTKKMSQDGGVLPFEYQYLVRCASPIDRELFPIELGV